MSDAAGRPYDATQSSNFDAELNRTTVHDSGIYDPTDTEDRIVLMFETAADATAAQARLSEAGIGGRAEVMSHTRDGIDAGTDYEGGEHGVWSFIKSFFTSDSHAHGYAEGVRRGHALLVVHPDQGRRLETVRLLETTGPIDFDARLEEWRSAGWDNLAHGQATAPTAPATGPAQVTVYDTATHSSHVEERGTTSGAPATGTQPGTGSHPVDYPTIGNTTNRPLPRSSSGEHGK